jgi:hypothetical protein
VHQLGLGSDGPGDAGAQLRGELLDGFDLGAGGLAVLEVGPGLMAREAGAEQPLALDALLGA